MADYVGAIKRWERGDTLPTNAEGGFAGADSTAAAVGTALSQAGAAQQTIQNLQGAATTLPAGSAATVTVTGSGTTKVINVGIPKGEDGAPGAPGMGYTQGQALVAQNQTTLAAAQSAQADAAQSAEEVTLAMQARFLTQDEGVAALIETSAGPMTKAALNGRFLSAVATASTGAKGVNGSTANVIGAGSDAYVILGGTGSFPHVLDPGTSLPIIPGGYDNKVGTNPGASSPAIMSVLIGAHHLADSPAGHGTVSGGSFHATHADYATIGGGTQNTVAGPFGAVGGGRNNRIAPVVTTLSATASPGATTITTVASLTAGHRVYIGHGRATQARIISSVSGTTSTLDAPLTNTAASGQPVVTGDNSTVDSATIGGGSSNQARGTYCTVAGGFNNKTFNTAATVAGGQNNSANGAYSTIGGGDQNTTSGSAAYSGVLSGFQNTASGSYAAVVNGTNSTASGQFASAQGNGALADHYGEVARAAGGFSTNGDAQSSTLVARANIAGNSTVELFLDLSTQRITLSDKTAYAFRVTTIAYARASSSIAPNTIVGRWVSEGAISRATGAGTTSMFTNNTTADAGNVAGFALTVAASTAYGALTLTGKCLSSYSTFWVATVELTKVSG